MEIKRSGEVYGVVDLDKLSEFGGMEFDGPAGGRSNMCNVGRESVWSRPHEVVIEDVADVFSEPLSHQAFPGRVRLTVNGGLRVGFSIRC